MPLTLKEIMDAIRSRWSDGADPTDADWTEAVVADPTEPRTYEEAPCDPLA